MGCSASTTADTPLPTTTGGVDTDEHNDEKDDQHTHRNSSVYTDSYVTVEEAAAYVEQDLGMAAEQAERLVMPLDRHADARISSVELVQLVARIKEIKVNLQSKFEQYDPDMTGFVKPQEAVSIMSHEFHGLPESCILAMVQRYDRDHNEMVDFSEIVEFYACLKAKFHDIEACFHDLDTDASGDLDPEELFQILMRECALKDFQVHSLVDDFDINKDGKIDHSEFLNMWTNLFG